VFLPVEVPDGPVGTAVVSDAAELAASREWGVLYLDPPYTARRYGGYYHLPELIARGAEPRPRGASGITALPHRPSPYYSKGSLAALRGLLQRAQFELLVLHYSDTGLMDPAELTQTLSEFGSVTTTFLPAVGYRTTAGSRGVVHRVLMVTP
jgi:adenine-specific DNA-methyltransferase